MDRPLRTSDTPVTVDETDFARRIIEPTDFVADTSAFVDVRLPKSAGKASYSFIGPGVSQNADQTVNIREAHGFNLGAATMPSGVINNPHMHYTAEVFICTRGDWKMVVGEHGQQTFTMTAGDVFAAPTWVFRGFENIGADDGFLFVALGGDDTGGIIWAPEILARAAETGLHLAADHSVIEVSNDSVPDDVLKPLAEHHLEDVDAYTDGELRGLLVTPDELSWSSRALLSSVLPGHESELAPVIGFGISQNRRHRAKVSHPHGFSLEWLRLSSGSSTGRHRIDATQALLLVEGCWEITLNSGPSTIVRTPPEGSVVSVPSGAWRDLRNIGDGSARAAVICGSDAPTKVEWDSTVAVAAFDAGWAIDAGGHVAPAELLGRPL
jgi:quercetin dioxygenase-like cupin family protein